MIFLEYDRGSILIRGEVRTPYGKWDPRVNAYRAMAIHYRDILDYFKESVLSFNDKVLNLLPHSSFSCNVKLRSYQKDALNLWIKNEKSGVIVLPTGAGKTFIALKAIQHLNTTSLVIVPTLDLVEQWRSNLMSKCKCLINGRVDTYSAAFPMNHTGRVSKKLEYIGYGVIVEVDGKPYRGNTRLKFYKTIKRKRKFYYRG